MQVTVIIHITLILRLYFVYAKITVIRFTLLRTCVNASRQLYYFMLHGAFIYSSHLPATRLIVVIRFPKYLPLCEGGAIRPGVVLLTGLMETMAKYGETIAYLNDRSGKRDWFILP